MRCIVHPALLALLGIVCGGSGFVIRRKDAEINMVLPHSHETPESESENGNPELLRRQDWSGRPSGASTADIVRHTSGNVPYNTIISTCTAPGIVALTFDDGPYIYTSHVLDVLEEYDAKATFFIVGNGGNRAIIDDESSPWPGLLRRMHSAGHQLGSHTWSHQDLTVASDDVRRQELIYNEMAFRNIFGWFPKYFRPPFATCESGCLEVLAELGYHVVNFNIDTKDYEHDSESTIQISKNTFADALQSDPNSHQFIELSHDVHEQTAYNLTEFMLQTLLERGYRAVTVGECLGDPPSNWYVEA